MTDFLQQVNEYILNKNLNYEANVVNFLAYKNLVLKDNEGLIKTIKIEVINKLPPTGMCHSAILYIKINPYTQTQEWLDEILTNKPIAHNAFKLK
jgi:hypothetical protein